MTVFRGTSIVSEIAETLINNPKERELFLIAFWSTVCIFPIVMIYFFFTHGYFDNASYEKFESFIANKWNYIMDKFSKQPLLPVTTKTTNYDEPLKMIYIYDPIETNSDVIHLYAKVISKN